MGQGFVYFIQQVGSDWVKIGFSTHPWKRLSGLKTAVAAELLLLWVFEGTRADERYLHWLFQNHRIRGEWFSFTAVVAGFRHYGVDPDAFPVPNREKFFPVPIKEPHRKVYPPADTALFLRSAEGLLIRKRRKRGRVIAKPKPKQKRRCGGVAWSSEAYQAKSSDMTVAQYRQMKQDIRDEWERTHPGEVPYWRSG